MIHRYALEVFGLKGRLAKLRSELIEAANKIDRLHESKATIDEFLHEMRDVFYVWESITLSEEMREAFRTNNWRDHERASDEKLRQAIKLEQKHVE